MKRYLMILVIGFAALICATTASGDDVNGTATSNSINSLTFSGSTQEKSLATSPYVGIQSQLLPPGDNNIKVGDRQIVITPIENYSLEILEKLAVSNSFPLFKISQWFEKNKAIGIFRTEDPSPFIRRLNGWPDLSKDKYMGCAIFEVTATATIEMAASVAMIPGIKKGANITTIYATPFQGKESEGSSLGLNAGLGMIQSANLAGTATGGGQDAKTSSSPKITYRIEAYFWRVPDPDDVKIKELTPQEKKEMEFRQGLAYLPVLIQSGQAGLAVVAKLFPSFGERLGNDLINSGGSINSSGADLNGVNRQLTQINQRLSALEGKWDQMNSGIKDPAKTHDIAIPGFHVPDTVVTFLFKDNSDELEPEQEAKLDQLVKNIVEFFRYCETNGLLNPKMIFSGSADQRPVAESEKNNCGLGEKRGAKLAELIARVGKENGLTRPDAEKFVVTTKGAVPSSPEEYWRYRAVNVYYGFPATHTPPINPSN